MDRSGCCSIPARDARHENSSETVSDGRVDGSGGRFFLRRSVRPRRPAKHHGLGGLSTAPAGISAAIAATRRATLALPSAQGATSSALTCAGTSREPGAPLTDALLRQAYLICRARGIGFEIAPAIKDVSSRIALCWSPKKVRGRTGPAYALDSILCVTTAPFDQYPRCSFVGSRASGISIAPSTPREPRSGRSAHTRDCLSRCRPPW